MIGNRRWPIELSGKACGAIRQTTVALEARKYSPSLELAFRVSRAL